MKQNWPSKKQWRHFFKVLNKKERVFFFILSFLFFGSLISLVTSFYLEKTEIVPKQGGFYVEGVIGSPRFINPLYSASSDVDRDLTELIFSGLMKYDKEGNIVPDVAKDYQVFENGKIYEFTLKENVLWHDSEKLTADDVVFTIESMQNGDVKSPLRAMWLGVIVEKISDYSLRFRLQNESSIFIENCTFKIIAKHVWENSLPKNFLLSNLNLSPTGSGPFKLKEMNKDIEGKIISLTLLRNEDYFEKKPYLNEISFRFFEEKDEEKTKEKLISAYNNKEIDGFSLNSIKNLSLQKKIYEFTIPRYFSVFFNPENSKALAQKEIRIALNHATDKSEIINALFQGEAKIVDSPILPDIFGFKQSSTSYEYDPEKANEILEQADFIKREDGIREKIIEKQATFTFKRNLVVGSQGDDVKELQKCLANASTAGPEIYPEAEITGYFGAKTKTAVVRFQEKYRKDILDPIGLSSGTGDVKGMTIDKLNEVCFTAPEEKIPLIFTLYTAKEQALEETAEILKSQWEKVGIKINIETFNGTTAEGDRIIRKREYDMLLFGETLGLIPDPFPFWHSSQKGEIGLNLANYENKKADVLLEENRELLEPEQRKEKLEEFQEILLSDCPVLFLYNPYYRYFVSDKIKGVEEDLILESSKRFVSIQDWYINTKRDWINK